MGFIDLGNELAEVQEAPLAPEGEYDLAVHSVEHDTDNGKNNIIVGIKFLGENFQPFRHYISLPLPSDAQKDQEKGNPAGTTQKTKLLMLKRFLVAFNIPFEANGFDPMDIQGATARVKVGQRSYNDAQTNEPRLAQTLRLPNLPQGA